MKSLVKLCAVGALILGLGGFAAAATQPSPTSVAPSVPTLPATPGAAKNASTPAGPSPMHALTADDVGAYFDGFIPDAIRRGDIAGAVIVVVKDGQPLFERGYGWADIKAQKPVDPATTLFRPGSISKTFTWTAVMQQVEAGKIDLDADINRYLDFKVPAYQGQPMTMRQLMTHSEGFSDQAKDLIITDPKKLQPLDALLKHAIPARIFPPGKVPAYSNYGASLAGYIVQRLSGEPFDAYIAHHIFAPLGMAHSTFTQPLPANFAPDMASGYRVASVPAGKFEIVQLAPAGSLSASGGDMAKFMIAQLNDGEYQGQRILQAKTAEEMHSPQFRPVPGLPAMALGFYQEPGNGHRVIGHAGDLANFHSDMHLYLDDHVGVFLSFNSAGAAAAAHTIRNDILRSFTARYIAPPPPQEPTAATAKADARKLAGLYVMTRRSDTGWLRIAHFLIGQSKITADKDGVVTVSDFRGLNNKPKHWREVGPFQYREVNGDSRMAATVENGKVGLVMSDDLPPVLALTPVSPVMSASWNTPLFYFALAVIVIAALAWPIAAIVRRRYGHKFELTGRAATLYRLTRLTCAIDLICVGCWFAFLTYIEGSLDAASASTDGMLRGLQLLGVLGVLGAVAAVLNAATVLTDGGRSWWAKVSSVLIAIACLAFAWFQFSLHLLNPVLAY